MDEKPRITLRIPDPEDFEQEDPPLYIPVRAGVVDFGPEWLQCFLAHCPQEDGPEYHIWDRLAVSGAQMLCGLLEARGAYYHEGPARLLVEQIMRYTDTRWAERAAELEAVFLPPGLRFLLDGPVPPLQGSYGSTGNPEAHTVETSPVPFGVGRMLFAGSPDTVVERIRGFHQATGIGVIDLMFSAGQIPDADVRRSVELFGREVLPRIRDLGAPAPERAVAASA
jgi:hypothetical protein